MFFVQANLDQGVKTHPYIIIAWRRKLKMKAQSEIEDHVLWKDLPYSPISLWKTLPPTFMAQLADLLNLVEDSGEDPVASGGSDSLCDYDPKVLRGNPAAGLEAHYRA